VRALGGAIDRVPDTATAYARRRARLVCSAVAAGFEPSAKDVYRAWVESITDGLRSLATGYLNFVESDGDRLADVCPQVTLPRLAAVKRRYDPGNVFRRNLNVKPTS
jgi:hypothetical protein